VITENTPDTGTCFVDFGWSLKMVSDKPFLTASHAELPLCVSLALWHKYILIIDVTQLRNCAKFNKVTRNGFRFSFLLLLNFSMRQKKLALHQLLGAHQYIVSQHPDTHTVWLSALPGPLKYHHFGSQSDFGHYWSRKHNAIVIRNE